MQDIFGGSKSKSSQSSTPKDLTPPAYQALRNPIAQALLQFFTTGGPTYQPGQNSTLGSSPGSVNPDWWNKILAAITPGTVTSQGQNATAKTPVVPSSPFGVP